MEAPKPKVGAAAGARRRIFVKKCHANGRGHGSDQENIGPAPHNETKTMWLVCELSACRKTYGLTPGSQAFYKSVGKGTPKYCTGCRN